MIEITIKFLKKNPGSSLTHSAWAVKNVDKPKLSSTGFAFVIFYE